MHPGGLVEIVTVRPRWKINAEHCFRKAGISVNTLNKNRLFRKMGLEVGTEQEYMEYRLSNGKRLSEKKQEKFIAGIVGAANPNLMTDMLVLKRATTENGQNMLVDAILGWGEKYPEETMISITTVQRFASLGDSARLKIEEYLEKHGKEAAIGKLPDDMEDEFLAMKEATLREIAAIKEKAKNNQGSSEK